jgi:hypothetical protein
MYLKGKTDFADPNIAYHRYLPFFHLPEGRKVGERKELTS